MSGVDVFLAVDLVSLLASLCARRNGSYLFVLVEVYNGARVKLTDIQTDNQLAQDR